MKDWLIAALAGAAAGVLSGLGVGGGSLLLIYMTSFTGVPQTLAQGINLRKASAGGRCAAGPPEPLYVP